MKQRKKKAFTLTELLVVVVIIGVLSAVVLPKFNKTLETRRTTEAEDIMRAVRTEQEYRCAADKPYATNKSDLSSWTGNNTKNYQFLLDSDGIVATRTGKNYNLRIPSYADGRICCDGSGCSSLNRDYPRCDDLVNHTSDYVASPSDCRGEVIDPIPAIGACNDGDTHFVLCGDCNNGKKTTEKCVGGVWQPYNGECITDFECTCPQQGSAADPDTQVCNGCGTQTRTQFWSTSTCRWEWNDWGACSVEPNTCPCAGEAETETDPEPCNGCGERTRTQVCDHSDGHWTFDGVEWGECSKTVEECGGVSKKCSEWDAELSGGLVAYCTSKSKVYQAKRTGNKTSTNDALATTCCTACKDIQAGAGWSSAEKKCMKWYLDTEDPTETFYAYRVTPPAGEIPAELSGSFEAEAGKEFYVKTYSPINGSLAQHKGQVPGITTWAEDTWKKSDLSCGAVLPNARIISESNICPKDVDNFCSACNPNSGTCVKRCLSLHIGRTVVWPNVTIEGEYVFSHRPAQGDENYGCQFAPDACSFNPFTGSPTENTEQTKCHSLEANYAEYGTTTPQTCRYYWSDMGGDCEVVTYKKKTVRYWQIDAGEGYEYSCRREVLNL